MDAEANERSAERDRLAAELEGASREELSRRGAPADDNAWDECDDDDGKLLRDVRLGDSEGTAATVHSTAGRKHERKDGKMGKGSKSEATRGASSSDVTKDNAHRAVGDMGSMPTMMCEDYSTVGDGGDVHDNVCSTDSFSGFSDPGGRFAITNESVHYHHRSGSHLLSDGYRLVWATNL